MKIALNSKHLKAEEVGGDYNSGATAYAIYSSEGTERLGTIGWYENLKSYCFSPYNYRIFNPHQLRQVAKWCHALTTQHIHDQEY